MSTPIRPGAPVAPKRPTDNIAETMLADDPEPVETAKAAAPSENEAAESEPQVIEKPLDRWHKAIKAAGITEEQAYTILDSIVEKGFYQQEYRIFHGRIRVTLRTRDSSTLRRVSDALDMSRTNDPRVHQQVTSRVLLIDSLAAYQKHTFEFAQPGDKLERVASLYAIRERAVDALPDQVYSALLAVLFKFDQAVYAASSEGDVEAF